MRKETEAMLFSSNVFLFAFLPAVLLCYFISPRRLRNPVLLLFSLFFYGWGEPVYLFLMLGDILLNYAYLFAERFLCVFPDVYSVYEYSAFFDIIKSRYKTAKRGLTTT
jgi:hypothetical protein